jgi:hypothetical protein
MRTHLITNGRNMRPAKWHCDASRAKNNEFNWGKSIPYTNVLWIRHILKFLIHHWCGSQSDLNEFKDDVKELFTRLDPRSRADRAFGSATDVLQFCYEQEWIDDDIIEGAKTRRSKGKARG